MITPRHATVTLDKLEVESLILKLIRKLGYEPVQKDKKTDTELPITYYDGRGIATTLGAVTVPVVSMEAGAQEADAPCPFCGRRPEPRDKPAKP